MAKRKVNKSQKIRDYIDAHPKAKAGEIAKALKVRPGLVYNVIAKMKDAGNKQNGRKGRKSATSNGIVSANGSIHVADDVMVLAAQLLNRCGSASEANRVLQVVSRVADTLDK